MKKVIQKILGVFGYQLTKIKRPGASSQPKQVIAMSNVLALTISDILLRRLSPDFGPLGFSFVQIGANDGSSFDPIRRFILKYGFKGLLVEPQPDVFERLKINYANVPNLAFLNVAIGQEDGTASLFRFKKSPSLPDWADCLASFSKETLLKNYHNVKGEIEELSIPTMSLNNLFLAAGFKEIDLLQIDAEGYDYEILKMLETCEFRPKLLSFEHGFMTEEVRYECFAYLNRLGYKVTNNHSDTVAYLEPKWQELFPIDIQGSA